MIASAVLITISAIPACTGKQESKYFAGTITYAYTYESDVYDKDSLARERPSKGEFRYDEQNYMSRFTGKDTMTYYYSGLLNKCVSVPGSGDDYTCEDYSAETDSILSWNLIDTSVIVLGEPCRILDLQKKNSAVRYYISRETRIAPATYNRHRSYNMDFYGEKSNGGLILKLEHRFKHFTMKGEATTLERMKQSFSALEMTDDKIKNICSKSP